MSGKNVHKRSWRRWLLYVAVAVAVVFFALVIAVPLVVSGERVRAFLSEELSRALERQVSVGEVSVGLIRGVQIEGLAIQEDARVGEGEFVRAERAHAKVALLPLLRRTVRVRLVLTGCTINFVRTPERTLNVESFLVREPKPPGQWTILATVVVRSTTVRIEDRVSGSQMEISDMDLSMGPILVNGPGEQPPVEANLSAQLTSGHRRGYLAVRGIVLPFEQMDLTMNLRSLPIDALPAFLGSRVSLPIAEGAVDGTLRVVPSADGLEISGGVGLDGARLAEAPAGVLPKIDVAVHGMLQPGTGRTHFREVKMEAPGATVSVSGEAFPRTALEGVGEANLSAMQQTLRALPGWPEGTSMSGSATLRFSFAAIDDGLKMMLNAHLNDFRAGVPGAAEPMSLPGATEIDCEARTKNGGILIESLSVRPTALALRVTGEGRIKPPNSVRAMEMNLKISADVNSLMGFVRSALALPDGFSGNGKADVTTRVLIRGDDIDCEAEGRVDGLELSGLLPDKQLLRRSAVEFSVQAHKRGARVDLPAISLRDPAFSAALSGEIADFATNAMPRLSGTFSLLLHEVPGMLGTLVPKDMKMAGLLKSTVQVTPAAEGTGFSLEADCTAPEIQYDDVLNKKANERLVISTQGRIGAEGFVLEPLTLAMVPGTLTVRATLDKAFRHLDATIASDAINLAALVKWVPLLAEEKLSGTASVNATVGVDLGAEHISKTLSGTFRVRSEGMTLRDYAITSAALDGKIQQGRIVLEPSVLKAYGGDVRIEGEIDPFSERPAFRIDATGQDLTMNEQLPILKFPIPVLGAAKSRAQGVFHFTASLEGEGADAETVKRTLRGVGRIGSGSSVHLSNPWLMGPLAPFSDFRFDSVSGEFEVGNGRVVNDDLNLISDKLDVLVRGWTDLNGPIHYALTLQDKADLFGKDVQKLMQYLSPDGKSVVVEVGGMISNPRPQIISASLVGGILRGILQPARLSPTPAGPAVGPTPKPEKTPVPERDWREERRERIQDVLERLRRRRN